MRKYWQTPVLVILPVLGTKGGPFIGKEDPHLFDNNSGN